MSTMLSVVVRYCMILAISPPPGYFFADVAGVAAVLTNREDAA